VWQQLPVGTQVEQKTTPAGGGYIIMGVSKMWKPNGTEVEHKIFDDLEL